MKLVVLSLVALLASACFTAEAKRLPEPEKISPAMASADAVTIMASDYKYEVSRHSATAGSIDFVVTNDAKQQHEFVIVPVHDGRFDLPLGELEPFDPGSTRAIRANLAPGRYQFVCLIVSIIDSEPRPHMARGMNVEFVVTP